MRSAVILSFGLHLFVIAIVILSSLFLHTKTAYVTVSNAPKSIQANIVYYPIENSSKAEPRAQANKVKHKVSEHFKLPVASTISPFTAEKKTDKTLDHTQEKQLKKLKKSKDKVNTQVPTQSAPKVVVQYAQKKEIQASLSKLQTALFRYLKNSTHLNTSSFSIILTLKADQHFSVNFTGEMTKELQAQIIKFIQRQRITKNLALKQSVRVVIPVDIVSN